MFNKRISPELEHILNIAVCKNGSYQVVAADPYAVGLLPHSLILYYFKEECDETDAVMDELEDWCTEHTRGLWYSRGYFGPGPYYKWFFQDKSDAVLFKLTFGGRYVLNN